MTGGGGVNYVGAGDDEATDAERLSKVDYRGGGGIKRYVGDIEDDTPNAWVTGDGITKKPKKLTKQDDTPGTPMRSQKELYVDYDKLAEFEDLPRFAHVDDRGPAGLRAVLQGRVDEARRGQ